MAMLNNQMVNEHHLYGLQCSIAGLYYHRVFSIPGSSLPKTRAWMAIVHVVLAEDAHGLFLSAGIKSFSQ